MHKENTGFCDFLDFTAAIAGVLRVLTLIGYCAMKGNPFFVQFRPGKIDAKTGQERIFKLYKFRTMTNERDTNGNYLPDEKRLNR